MKARFIDKFDVILLDMGRTFMFDVDRAKIVFVGDSLKRDIAGAKSVGLSVVWIDLGLNHVDDSSFRPDRVIRDLRDLLEP